MPQLHDNPIIDPDKDLLNRSSLAKNIAKLVLRDSSKESFTVGIIGKWGSGKSTVLQFIRHYVEKGQLASELGISHTPVVIEFNPWWFNGREDLYKLFLMELLQQLKHKKEIVDRIKGFSSPVADLKKRGEKVKGAVREGLSNLNDFLESIKFGDDIKLEDAPIFNKAPQVLKFLEKLLADKQLSLTDSRLAVESLLNDLQIPVWIFIEDFDRLETETLKAMIGLLRSFSNLSYTRYFIAFDPEVVGNQLDPSQDRLYGEKYIEKLVQIPVFLNEPNEQILAGIFVIRMQEVMSFQDTIGVTKLLRFSEQELAGFYLEFQPFISTMRQINRIASSIAAIPEYSKNNIHPRDFLLLEVLKMIAPSLWIQLPNLKSELLGFHHQQPYNRNRTQPETIPSTQLFLLSQVSSFQKEQIWLILIELFPHLATKQKENSHEFNWSPRLNGTELKISYRIASPDVFRGYFGLEFDFIEIAKIEKYLSAVEIGIERLEEGLLAIRPIEVKNTDEEKSKEFIEIVELLFLHLYMKQQTIQYQNLCRLILRYGDQWIQQEETNFADYFREKFTGILREPFIELNPRIRPSMDIFDNAYSVALASETLRFLVLRLEPIVYEGNTEYQEKHTEMVAKGKRLFALYSDTLVTQFLNQTQAFKLGVQGVMSGLYGSKNSDRQVEFINKIPFALFQEMFSPTQIWRDFFAENFTRDAVIALYQRLTRPKSDEGDPISLTEEVEKELVRLQQIQTSAQT